MYSWAETVDSLNNMTSYTINYYSVTGQKLGSYLCIPGQTFPQNGNYQPSLSINQHLDAQENDTSGR